jgi:glucosamine--fructose-6-phosphate aminotransferase (isomerizing)
MTDRPNTAMATEMGETPEAVARFFDREDKTVRSLGSRLRALAPAFVATCARGSSDHATAYFKYVLEIVTGIPAVSIGPSVASIYRAPLRLKGAVLLSVSQSGQSTDIISLQAAARAAGALAIAIVNNVESSLALEADIVLPLHAGIETSVAATKTCIASAVALAAMVAEFHDNATLRAAVRGLPNGLARSLMADWSAAMPILAEASSAYVVGRGPALPVAMESALKLKETAALHAEAFSGAEVMHGPLQLLHAGFPVLAFRQSDAAYSAMGDAVAHLRSAGGHVFVAEEGPPAPLRLPSVATGDPLLDPLAMLLSFYRLAEAVARARGHDPDRPDLLRKVTVTV